MISKIYLFFCLSFLNYLGFSQLTFSWVQKANMPNRISNNAVTSATIAGSTYVYSFGGIDSTKLYSGITRKSYRYNVTANIWDTIAQLPDTSGKIASSAVTVKNKIYIIGGYHVLANTNEVSSNRVHIYNPVTNTYLANGLPIPFAIDDQVMSVWRDSLIFVVTGWSNTTNTDKVQIYNPALNTWSVGTPVPNTNNYKAFGASGTIIGDTIYYCGGASTASNFPAVSVLRKGAINPTNPSQITWSFSTNANAKVYRSGSSSFNNTPLWFGGSLTTYNYNGIAYNGSGGVAAQNQVVYLNTTTNQLVLNTGQIPNVMDLRSVAKISTNEYILAGGMQAAQQVSNATYKITVADVTSQTENTINNKVVFFPNPVTSFLTLQRLNLGSTIELFNSLGEIVYHTQAKSETETISVKEFKTGIYLLSIIDKGKHNYTKIVIEN